MRKTFTYQFYTTEFDQEMLDFIEQGGGKEVGDNEWSIDHENLYYGIGVGSFWTDDDPDCRSYHYKTKQEFKSIIGMRDSQQTYTQSELSYIESLEDEVVKLEELCSDYAKIVAEKEYMIKMLQGVV